MLRIKCLNIAQPNANKRCLLCELIISPYATIAIVIEAYT